MLLGGSFRRFRFGTTRAGDEMVHIKFIHGTVPVQVGCSLCRQLQPNKTIASSLKLEATGKSRFSQRVR